MTTRYLDINSAFRNRIQYPKQCDFVIELNATNYNNASSSNDPILLSFPYETNLTSGGSSTTQIALSVTSTNIINYYRNSVLQIGNEYRIITAYNNSTQVATVSPGFSVAPFALTQYTIRYQFPSTLNGNQYQDTTAALSNSNTIQLGGLASNINNIYKDSFIFIPGSNSPYSYQWRRITAYNGTTKVATLVNSFYSPVPAGSIYEICPFSYNNINSLRYVGTEVGVNNPVCNTLSLLALILPNRQVLNGYGGLVTDYPYVYVNVYPENNRSFSSPIISNSPFVVSDALFKCPITFYNNSAFLSLISTGMSPKISFKENDSFRIQIFLPNGEILQLEDDPNIINYSSSQYGNNLFPIPSQPYNQVNLTLQVTRG